MYKKIIVIILIVLVGLSVFFLFHKKESQGFPIYVYGDKTILNTGVLSKLTHVSNKQDSIELINNLVQGDKEAFNQSVKQDYLDWWEELTKLVSPNFDVIYKVDTGETFVSIVLFDNDLDRNVMILEFDKENKKFGIPRNNKNFIRDIIGSWRNAIYAKKTSATDSHQISNGELFNLEINPYLKLNFNGTYTVDSSLLSKNYQDRVLNKEIAPLFTILGKDINIFYYQRLKGSFDTVHSKNDIGVAYFRSGDSKEILNNTYFINSQMFLDKKFIDFVSNKEH